MLRDGARIAVVSPSGISDPARLDRGLAVARSWGYDLVELPHVCGANRYFAGTDAERLADLATAFSGDFDAVWAARGGYGLSRLVMNLPWSRLARVPFIGFSDGTVLLNALVSMGRPAVHGPVLHALADHNNEATRSALRAVLAGAAARLSGSWLLGEPPVDEAVVAGGNLCSLASTCGTPLQFDATGKIVLLEDLGEPPYKLDRLLIQCRDSGCFDGAVAFALGDFLDAAPPEGANWTLDEVFLDVLGPLGVPILKGIPVGHGRYNHALPLGTPARFEGAVLVVEPA